VNKTVNMNGVVFTALTQRIGTERRTETYPRVNTLRNDAFQTTALTRVCGQNRGVSATLGARHDRSTSIVVASHRDRAKREHSREHVHATSLPQFESGGNTSRARPARESFADAPRGSTAVVRARGEPPLAGADLGRSSPAPSPSTALGSELPHHSPRSPRCRALWN